MTVDVNETFFQAKKNHLKVLNEEYLALYEQMSGTLDAADKVAIKKKIEIKENEIQSLGNEINELRSSYRKSSVRWEEKLHRINYKKVGSILKKIFKPLRKKEGAALFVIEKSHAMGGKWCAEKIKHHIYEEIGSRIKHTDVAFATFQSVDELSLLNKLAEFCNDECLFDLVDIEKSIQIISKNIFDSLESGHTFLLEIDIHSFLPDNRFLLWFANDFWAPLTNQLQAISNQKEKIRLIAVMKVRGPVPKPCLPENICCSRTNFSSCKFLKLPLQKWTEAEICDWLFNYSDLSSERIGLEGDEIKQMARNIHYITQGTPQDVYHFLFEEMTQYAS